MALSRFFNLAAGVLLLSACAGPQTKAPLAPPTSKTSSKNQLPATEIVKDGELLKLGYDGFTIWLDCKERGPVKFRYNAQRDSGDVDRAANFAFDPNVPRECQQTSTKGYGNGYDRGHQVPANHLDYSETAIRQSNYMTNILPQASNMNRGAWLRTEEIIECYRDIDELLVLGGVLWGDNSKDDYFVESHGVRTPDYFWKVVVRGNGEAIAWIIPNSQDARETQLDRYLTSVADVEKRTAEHLPVSGDARTQKPKSSWLVPAGCNKS